MPFDSLEFKNLVYEWGITITAPSPIYAQSNGQVERCEQTLKEVFKKADEDGRDPYLAVLEYRNTPLSGLQYTRPQILMSRWLRSKLPAKQTLLQPNVVDAQGVDSSDRRCTTTHVYRLCSTCFQVMLCASREETCGSLQLLEARISSQAPTWCRTSMYNCDVPKGNRPLRLILVKYV